MARAVTVDSTVVVATDQVSCDLSGDAVILSLKGGVYYGLDGVGGRIWTLIQEPRVVREVRDLVLEEYDVDADRCEQDVLALLRDLAGKGLVEVKGEEPA
jgi:hypothetical protein